MLRLALTLLLTFLLSPNSGFTQVQSQLSKGEQLRIIINHPETRRSLRMSNRPTVVRFIALTNDSLYVEYRSQTIPLPLNEIDRIEQKTGKTKGNAGIGAMVGGLTGLVLAGLDNSESNRRSRESTGGNIEIISREESTMIRIGLGMGLGALAGVAIRSPKWEIIDLALLTPSPLQVDSEGFPSHAREESTSRTSDP